jgi:hypothetical protein
MCAAAATLGDTSHGRARSTLCVLDNKVLVHAVCSINMPLHVLLAQRTGIQRTGYTALASYGQSKLISGVHGHYVNSPAQLPQCLQQHIMAASTAQQLPVLMQWMVVENNHGESGTQQHFTQTQ